MFCKVCQVLQISFYFSEDTYFLGAKGFKSCTNGSAITNKTECVAACNYLKLPLKSMTDGKNCFRAGNGDCKQSGSHGSTAKLVCKKQGNKLPNTICLKIYIIIIIIMYIMCIFSSCRHQYR